MNYKLIELTNSFNDTIIFDLNYFMAKYGVNNVFDPRIWFTAKIPYKIDFISYLAKKYSQFIKSYYIRKKCLVLDLDNTLWGGIIGEDGIDGIQLGYDYPGNVYREIQQVIKQYSNQGIIIAINSKNNSLFPQR